MIWTHLPQDPLAKENYGPTENLHDTFLKADHSGGEKNTTPLLGWTYKGARWRTKKSQQAGDKSESMRSARETRVKLCVGSVRVRAASTGKLCALELQSLRSASCGTSMPRAAAHSARFLQVCAETRSVRGLGAGFQRGSSAPRVFWGCWLVDLEGREQLSLSPLAPSFLTPPSPSPVHERVGAHGSCQPALNTCQELCLKLLVC